jgi:hypothetical protein
VLDDGTRLPIALNDDGFYRSWCADRSVASHAVKVQWPGLPYIEQDGQVLVVDSIGSLPGQANPLEECLQARVVARGSRLRSA